MAKGINNYTDESITSYEGPAALRRRPQTLLGSADVHGAIHTVFEIFANATDEFSAGFGDSIYVQIDNDNSVTVVDHGRGVPMAWNEAQKKFNWDLVFNTLYASGKGNKDAAYNDSEGLNGCGCTATQFTSDYMDVRSIRELIDENGTGTREFHQYDMHFEKGYPVGELKDTKLEGVARTGTTVKYRPSAEVFNGETDLPKEQFISRFTLKAIAYPGLQIKFKYKDDPELEFYYPDGMAQYLSENVKGAVSEEYANIAASSDKCNDTKDKNPNRNYEASMECCIVFAPDSTVQSTFHNGALLKGGPTHEAVFTGVAKALTSQAKAMGKLNNKESFKVSDINSITNFVCQTRCNADYSLYEHQTKDALNNPSICKLITSAVDVQLTKWLSSHNAESERIVGFALANKNARENADKVRRQAIKQLTQDIRKIGREPQGYIDCTSKDPAKSELYIIEGESAKGNCVFARDKDTQAIQALRGKILNCLKRPIDVLLAEKSIVLQLLTLFGCGVEINSKTIKDLPKFDESKLNFHKIVLAADADVDGGHIIDLCITMIWVFCPTLIRKGYVYTVKAPLYKVTVNKQSEYYYNDAEKDRCLRELVAKGYKNNQIQVKRFKGLGEMVADELRDTVLNKDKRQLQRLTLPDNEEEFAKLLNTYMGTDLEARRELIISNFETATAVDA